MLVVPPTQWPVLSCVLRFSKGDAEGARPFRPLLEDRFLQAVQHEARAEAGVEQGAQGPVKVVVGPGLDRTGLAGYLVATAYNLVRLARLVMQPDLAQAA